MGQRPEQEKNSEQSGRTKTQKKKKEKGRLETLCLNIFKREYVRGELWSGKGSQRQEAGDCGTSGRRVHGSGSSLQLLEHRLEVGSLAAGQRGFRWVRDNMHLFFITARS